jgi:hypothetical protein
MRPNADALNPALDDAVLPDHGARIPPAPPPHWVAVDDSVGRAPPAPPPARLALADEGIADAVTDRRPPAPPPRPLQTSQETS